MAFDNPGKVLAWAAAHVGGDETGLNTVGNCSLTSMAQSGDCLGTVQFYIERLCRILHSGEGPRISSSKAVEIFYIFIENL